VVVLGLAAIVQAPAMLNKYFGVGVTSGAKDGVAPELSPGWAQRRKNTHPEGRRASFLLTA